VAMDQRVQLWLNGASLGEIALQVPDLADAGYRIGAGNGLVYAGWRKGVIYIPGSALRTGENSFQFARAEAGIASPMAARNVTLQLKFNENPLAPKPSLTVTPSPEMPAAAASASNT